MKIGESEKKSMSKNYGQGMTEYIIIVALIAISAIGVFTAFGDTVRNQVAGMSAELAGNDAATQITAAGTSATEANTQATSDKGLSSYNDNGGSGGGGGGN